MAKRKKKRKPMVVMQDVPIGDGKISIAWEADLEISDDDVAKANEVVTDIREISDAGFTENERMNLIRDVLTEAGGKISALFLHAAAMNRGEPLIFEAPNGKWEADVVRGDDDIMRTTLVKIPNAKYGRRVSKREGESFYTTLDQAPEWLTDDERETWAKSPALVIGAGIIAAKSEDSPWMQLIGQIEGRASGNWEKATIEHFNSMQNSILTIAQAGVGKLMDANYTEAVPNKQEILHARVAWAACKQARIFHIDPFIYAEIYHQCDVYTEEVIGGAGKGNWRPTKFDAGGKLFPNPDMTEEESKLFSNALRTASVNAPMPEHFPFEVMYLGYGHGIDMKMDQLFVKFSELGWRPPENMASAKLIGDLVLETGWIFEVLEFVVINDGERATGYACVPIRKPDVGFTPTFDLSPWYVTKVVDFVNSHRAYVIEDDVPMDLKKKLRSTRKDGEGKGGRLRSFWIPPPYYRLRMKDRIIHERVRKMISVPSQNAAYRTDRIGHPRLYVRRGKLPLKPEDREKLVAREYKVFEATNPSPEIRGELLRKGHLMKHPDEWLAVREIWIDQTMTSTDESLPYVPALRTTGSIQRKAAQ